MISPPTETVTIWAPVTTTTRDDYGNSRPPTYDDDHRLVVSGAVVGDVEWAAEPSEEHPDGYRETVTIYLPKGTACPSPGCKVTVRGHDYLVTEGHSYDASGVPGPHNAWVRAVRRVGQ